MYHESGYQINDERNQPGVPGTSQGASNPWNNGNMPQIRDGFTGFNNIVCKIIYAKWHHVRYVGGTSWFGKENMLYTQRGGKALIYAAYAADYDEVVTYTPNPSSCTGDLMGNIFQMSNLLTHFNLNNPNRVSERMLDFTKHFGNDWYFCKREYYQMGLLDDKLPDGPLDIDDILGSP